MQLIRKILAYETDSIVKRRFLKSLSFLLAVTKIMTAMNEMVCCHTLTL